MKIRNLAKRFVVAYDLSRNEFLLVYSHDGISKSWTLDHKSNERDLWFEIELPGVDLLDDNGYKIDSLYANLWLETRYKCSIYAVKNNFIDTSIGERLFIAVTKEN